MEINALASTEPTTSSTQTTSLTEDFDLFLQLLTTQLLNQDPLDPADTNEFTQQLVDFASVEATIETNTHLEELISLQTTTIGNSAVDYIGKTVTVDGDESLLTGGQASWRYELPVESTSTTIEILNSEGDVVYTEPGQTSADDHLYYWDGTDTDGDTLPDGRYTLRVRADDASGEPISISTQSRDVVSSVRFEGGDIVLSFGDREVSMSEVEAIDGFY